MGKGASMKAHQTTNRSQASRRAEDLSTHMRAIRREQGLLVAELVWNEMRAWEIRGKLDSKCSPEDRNSLMNDLDKRLGLIRSMAEWEESADQSLGKLRVRLKLLLIDNPGLESEIADLREISRDSGLESIARSAAIDLGLRLTTP